MFEKILIANRGEIACRVMHTAKRMGIATVAVYSEADANSLHVAMADEAVLIGPPEARASYLVIENIISAALKTDAQAIHPGYGFLSENAEFAEACAAAGVVFIGPNAEAIRTMGEKAAAKALMEAANVPVVPGYHGKDQDNDLLAKKADEIGFPVLIKAVAGGGGKGMRMVETAEDFDKSLQSARREAMNAFGDDKVLVEKYLVQPRHIEIQVFGDSHGNVVHLFERDCSIQRRHQKIIEESPAPGMSTEMRGKMGAAAVQAAASINYVGAGTVEFIADVSEGLHADRFYFMEMNTRLQVEHPVTEMVTGQDLVAWQLLVAAGETLPATQEEIKIDGHAVEMRIYAENPEKNFFPSTGHLHRLSPPSEDDHVRIDSGVRQGDDVSIYYDPMIAKLVVWDKDRNGALRRARQALADYQVAGVISNIDFLSAVTAHSAFAAGDLETGFVDKYIDDLLPDSGAVPLRVLAVATLHRLLRRQQDIAAAAVMGNDPYSPWNRVDGWRLNDRGHDEVRFLYGGEVCPVLVYYENNGFCLHHEQQEIYVVGQLDGDGNLSAELDGLRVGAAVVEHDDDITVFLDGRNYRLRADDPMAGAEVDMDVAGDVTAPLPGKILQILCEEGASVRKGAALLILEAMKMEHTITAPANGSVLSLPYGVGDQVEEGVVLVGFEVA